MWFLIGYLIGIAMVLTSCSTVLKGKTGRPEIFKSQDYIVYMVGEKENSTTLAQKLLGDAGKAWLIEDNNPAGSFKRGQAVVIPLKEENIAVCMKMVSRSFPFFAIIVLVKPVSLIYAFLKKHLRNSWNT